MYLCPLGVLLVFAMGVLVLSIVLPRIQERRQAQQGYAPALSEAAFDPDEPLFDEELSSEDLLSDLWVDEPVPSDSEESLHSTETA
jgi:hypothetical protein